MGRLAVTQPRRRRKVRRRAGPSATRPAGRAATLASRAERERTERAKGDEAHTLAMLAGDTITAIAERAPDAALRSAFLAWAPVQAVLEDLERLRRL